MRVSQFIALRYLQTNRNNRFFSWIAILSIAGIAIGVAVMIVVLSVFNGFEKELRSRFLAANAHILAFRFPGGMEQPDEWARIFKRDFGDDLTGVSPFVHYQTMAQKDGLIKAVLVRGIDPERRAEVQDLRSLIRPPTALDEIRAEFEALRAGAPMPAQPKTILGVGVASALDLEVGDTVSFISPRDDSPTELRQLKLVGLYDSGLHHYDNKISILSLQSAQAIFNMGAIVTGFELGVKDPDASPEIAERMRMKYALDIRPWQSFNQHIFKAMEFERAAIALIVALVAFVASFNILTTLFVAVTQKQRDISILKALGARNRMIIALFLGQSLYIGTLGAGLGSLLAAGISLVLQRYEFVDLPELYMVATLPIDMDPWLYVTAALAGIVICAIAGVYPALMAARVSPTQGFRGVAET